MKSKWISVPVSDEFAAKLDGHIKSYEQEMREEGIPVKSSRSALIRILLEEWVRGREKE